MASGISLFLLLACAIAGQALTPSTFITTVDRTRLKAVFDSARPYQDLPSVHYSILGYKLLKETISNTQEACNYINKNVDPKSIESLYHATAASKALGSCKLESIGGAPQTLVNALAEESSVPDLFYAVSALTNLGQKFDSAKVQKALTAALKKDDSVLNLGYAFHIATLLSGDVNSLFERIEDAIVQADEVDGKLAQFEGGLSITAIIISGAYRLAEHVKKEPPVDADKCVKFANYFMSRKHVQVVRAAYYLLDVLNVFTTNKFHIPVSITLASKTAISNQEPTIQVRVTNLLGAALGQLGVSVDTATRLEDDAVVLRKKPLAASKTDSSLYGLNFMEAKPSRGFYRLSVSAIPSKADKRLVGNVGAPIEVKVMTEVSVEGLELGTVDIDQASSATLTKIQYPNKLPSVLEADYHQKLQMKFQLRDKNAGNNILAHQAFVRLVYQKTKQEIIFVAEPDVAQVYRFDMDINAKAKEVGYLSGRYKLDLIIGDSVIANPFSWYLADVELTFPDHPFPPTEQQNQYAPKPEIKHIFREPEKRPSQVVSNIFTGLSLAPFLLVLGLWIKIGVNISNFSLNLATIGFHLGLSSIFGLFIVFWLQLNMFTTLKYLILVGTVTFLCGNSMLSKIAAARKG